MNLDEIRSKALSFFSEKGLSLDLVEGLAGRGLSFERNEIFLKTIGLKTRVIREDFEAEIDIELFGRKTIPVMPAPLSGIVKAISEKWAEKVVEESWKAGALPWIGYPVHRSELMDLENFVWIIKPMKRREMIYREIEFAESRCLAVGIDLDSFHSEKIGGRVYPFEFLKALNYEELKNIVGATKLPFVAKGILNEKDYELAVKAGCKVVVISSRGGRLIESAASPIEILQKIEKVGDVSIGVDSFFRSGEDVLKAISLGADFVLVGRPVVYGLTFDGGVSTVLRYFADDLKRVMEICGVRSTKEAGKEILTFM